MAPRRSSPRPSTTGSRRCRDTRAVKEVIPIAFSAVIGSLSFAGSMIAFAKLQELIGGRPITFGAQRIVNAALAAVCVVLAVVLCFTDNQPAFFIAAAFALVLGIMLVLPIGGADMPVVISLLNSATGLAAAATGFVLHSNILIVSGTLVGASGTLLTQMMGRAMNRSISNVLFGAFGAVKGGSGRAPGLAARATASCARSARPTPR